MNKLMSRVKLMKWKWWAGLVVGIGLIVVSFVFQNMVITRDIYELVTSDDGLFNLLVRTGTRTTDFSALSTPLLLFGISIAIFYLSRLTGFIFSCNCGNSVYRSDNFCSRCGKGVLQKSHDEHANDCDCCGGAT